MGDGGLVVPLAACCPVDRFIEAVRQVEHVWPCDPSPHQTPAGSGDCIQEEEEGEWGREEEWWAGRRPAHWPLGRPY